MDKQKEFNVALNRKVGAVKLVVDLINNLFAVKALRATGEEEVGFAFDETTKQLTGIVIANTSDGTHYIPVDDFIGGSLTGLIIDVADLKGVETEQDFINELVKLMTKDQKVRDQIAKILENKTIKTLFDNFNADVTLDIKGANSFFNAFVVTGEPESFTPQELAEGIIPESYTLEDVFNVITSEESTSMSLKEKLKEDALIEGEKLKIQIAQARQTMQHNVDSTLSPEVFSFGTDVDSLSQYSRSVYQDILNRCSVLEIVKQLVTCLPIESVTFPKIPTFDFLVKIPTVDLMAFIDISLQGILDAILGAILAFLSSLTSILCAIAKDFGALTLQQLLDSDVPGAQVLKYFEDNGWVEFTKPGVSEANFGLHVNEVSTDNSALVLDIARFLDEVSSVLTPYELIKLLRGDATKRTLDVIQAIGLRFNFNPSLVNPFVIKNIFSGIGDIIDNDKMNEYLSVCNSATMKVVGDKLVCTDTDEIQKQLLENKGLSPAQVQDLLDQAAAAKEERINEYNDFVDKIKNGIDPIPLFCTKGKQPPALKGLPPSVERQLDSTMNTVFDGVYMAFDKEAAVWNDALIYAQNQKIEVSDQEIKTAIEKLITIDIPGITATGDTQLKSELEKEIKRIQMMSGMGAAEFATFYLLPAIGVTRRASLKPNITATKRQLVPQIKELNDSFVDHYSLELDEGFNQHHTITTDTRQVVDIPTGERLLDFAGTLFPTFETSFSSRRLIKVGEGASQGYNFSYKDLGSQQTVRAVPQQTRIDAQSLGETSLGQVLDNARFPQNESTVVVAGTENTTIEYSEDAVENQRSENEAETITSNPNATMIGPVKPGAPVDIFGYAPVSTSIYNVANQLNSFNLNQADNFDKYMFNTLSSFQPNLDNTWSSFFSQITLYAQTKVTEYALSNQTLFDEINGIPKLQLVRLNAQKELCSDIDPHLLKLARAKEEAKRKFKEELCAQQQPKMGEGGVRQSPRPGPVDGAILTAILKTTVRTYTVDLYLRGLLILNPIYSEDLIDPALSVFIAEEMKQELAFYGKNYQTDFLREIVKLYKQETGEERTTEFIALTYYVDKEIRSVSSDVSGLIEFDRARPSLKSVLLRNKMNLCDVPDAQGNRSLLNAMQIGDLVVERYYRIGGVVNNVLQFENDRYRGGSAVDKTYGLRISYVVGLNAAPSGEGAVGEPAPDVNISLGGSGITISAIEEIFGDNLDSISQKEKAFKTNDYITLPIISVEIPTNNNTDWDSMKEALFSQLEQKDEFTYLFDYCFPLSRFVSMMAIDNMILMRYINNNSVMRAFSTTKEQLRMLLYTAMYGGDYVTDKSEDPYLKALGGQKGLESLMRTPPEKLTAADLQALLDSPGFNYWQIIKFVLEAPVQIFRGVTESMDPNIFIASKMALFSRILGGMDVPVAAFSLALQPMTLFPGSWFGPPLTPFGMIYLALGLGFSMGPDPGQDGPPLAQKNPDGINTNSGIYNKDNCEDIK